jgi:hypothetical protein
MSFASLIKPFPGENRTGHQSYTLLLSQFALAADSAEVPKLHDIFAQTVSWDTYHVVKPAESRAHYASLQALPEVAPREPRDFDDTSYDRKAKIFRHYKAELVIVTNW